MDMNPFGTGPAGLFAQLAGGLGPLGHGLGRPPARAYDEYFRAYSVAMLPGRERENLSYGGKKNPAASTHAGVLEFIAEEGCVHLPQWMMKTLRLNEGDAIRVTGAELPKGQFVKLQAQSTMFLEISDPKAVLAQSEQALRNFSALTQGDIIDISYNSIVFGLLVMETMPGGEGISVLNTDLEVDFAAPVGYVEPERPKPPPPSTMASKLNIDVNSQTPGGDQWESFKGKGETLGGRKTKGKGIGARPIEDTVIEARLSVRSDQPRIVTNEILETEASAPAPCFWLQDRTLPTPRCQPEAQQSQTFTGSGNSLNGRATGQTLSGSTSSKGKAKEESSSSTSWGSGGQTLGARTAPVPMPDVNSQGRAPPSRAPVQKGRSPTPERAYDSDEMESDDESVIYISDDDD
ncbi:ubiquitin fusion degradation protein UFD1-domain-containing protein [Fomitopsis serialis]|uniref:ubiquitin fusion degradation protein UFD1-domain-containing protein n=1 Tax=Fomitopsis serialis TaxID=139415 RepID=UPI002007D7F7|nr:ubiquitin fusion degradation protein UFD1-domain-containing protein [Neoantrodia serialis]KAH9930685.1 ubiquitin fusion degradation protein UFD1-domain-containing protein [Neoantrodia serialis]